jgi:hypothetical protein
MRSRALAAALVALALAASARAAAPWTSPAPVPGSAGVGFPYDVAAHSDGTAAVAFIQGGIRVALRSPDGRWTQAEKVSKGNTGVAAPDVAFDGAGEILVAWTQNTIHGAAPLQGANYVRAAVRGADGRWGTPRTIGRTRHFIDGQPRLATDARGDTVLAWRGLRGSGAHARDVLQVSYRPAGGAFGAARSLGEAGIDLQVAIDARGTAYAAWSHTRAPYHVASSIRLAARKRTGGWGRAQTIYADSAGDPQLAPTPGGSLLLAWRGGQQGVGATRTGFAMTAERDAAGILSGALLLSTTRTVGPQIAVAPSGETVIAWSAPSAALDPTAGMPALQWTARPAGDTFALPPQMAPGLRAGPLAMLADGTAITVWSGTSGLRAAVRPPGGAFTAAEAITSRGDFPVLAAGDRLAVAVWLGRGRLMTAARPET